MTDSVWHYTSVQGLSGIVKKAVLWATSHRFMNDSREPQHATDTLREIAAEVREGLNSTDRTRFDGLMAFAERKSLEAFLLCAAAEPDLLTVWRGYGSAVPYAVELDATIELLPVEHLSGAVHPSPPSDYGPEQIDEEIDGRPILGPDPDDIRVEISPWASVQYDNTLALARVEHVAKLAERPPEPLADALIPWLNLGGIDLLQLKHPAFVDEREVRSVFEVYPRWKFVRHRATRFGLTPYIEVSAPDEHNRPDPRARYLTQPAAVLPIRAVHIGPSPLGSESVDALREFLELHGYPDVEVAKSPTPFR